MKIAYAGLGEVVHGLHLPALRHVLGAELVGGCDPSAERCDEWSATTGTDAFAGLDDLLAVRHP
jgi:predicted dehydrogenase